MNSIDFDKVRETAENYYRNGDFYCSEAVVKTIRDEFELEISDDAIAMASGFPVGMGGSGCTCGAITGGIMALGMVFGRKEAKDPRVGKAMEFSKKLHDDFKGKHNSLCCRFLTKGMELGSREHMNQCIAFTGEVAEKVARII
ncbi:MAG: C-GCAxxG-C-C family protein, partial [Clostridium argentinense]|nr:C-GCAxxG-C-C family protein [Clostridium argentinense]